MKQQYKLDPRAAFRRVGDEFVVVDVAENIIMKLNETGAFIWENLSDFTLDEIGRKMRDEFDVSEAMAQTDVTEFVEMLMTRGLVLKRENS